MNRFAQQSKKLLKSANKIQCGAHSHKLASVKPVQLTTESITRSYSDAAKRSYGNLSDEDRIFTNLYGQRDYKLKGALKRVCYFSLKYIFSSAWDCKL